jgi:hypothetical protein
LDIKWVRFPLVILESLGDFIEVPLLTSCVVSPSLQPDVVCTMALSDSVEGKLWDKVEWSVDVEAEFLIETLSFSFDLVNIQYSPSLVSSIMSWMSNYRLCFKIFITWYIKAFSILPIDKVFLLIFKDLPPSWVGAPNLHGISLSWAFDIKGLIIQSGSDCQRSLMEIPFLFRSTIWYLNDHISIVENGKVPVLW